MFFCDLKTLLFSPSVLKSDIFPKNVEINSHGEWFFYAIYLNAHERLQQNCTSQIKMQKEMKHNKTEFSSNSETSKIHRHTKSICWSHLLVAFLPHKLPQSIRVSTLCINRLSIRHQLWVSVYLLSCNCIKIVSKDRYCNGKEKRTNQQIDIEESCEHFRFQKEWFSICKNEILLCVAS